MKKTFACAVRPNKAPSMRRGLSIISLEHSYGLNGSRIFDQTQLAPQCTRQTRLRSALELQLCRLHFEVQGTEGKVGPQF